MEDQKEFKILSGIFEVTPKESVVTTRVGKRWLRFSNQKTYYVVRIDYSIKKSGESILFILDDEKGIRAFPVQESFARNKFTYLSESGIENQNEFIERFNQENSHITEDYQFKLTK